MKEEIVRRLLGIGSRSEGWPKNEEHWPTFSGGSALCKRLQIILYLNNLCDWNDAEEGFMLHVSGLPPSRVPNI
jgi:hypothetical protein